MELHEVFLIACLVLTTGGVLGCLHILKLLQGILTSQSESRRAEIEIHAKIIEAVYDAQKGGEWAIAGREEVK